VSKGFPPPAVVDVVCFVVVVCGCFCFVVYVVVMLLFSCPRCRVLSRDECHFFFPLCRVLFPSL
jgi:hypothetical protein